MINAKQIRAARAILGWSQQDLADAIGMSKPTIVEVERDGHQPRAETLGLILKSFENQGLEFIKNGVKERDDILTVFEGEDCVARFMDYVYVELTKTKGEILYYCADEKRSTAEFIKREQTLRDLGVRQKSLLKMNDTHIMGAIEEYRWMPDKLWSDSDAKMIFDDQVAYSVSWLNSAKVVLIKDRKVAEIEKRIFDFVWEISAKPTHSTSEVRYRNV